MEDQTHLRASGLLALLGAGLLAACGAENVEPGPPPPAATTTQPFRPHGGLPREPPPLAPPRGYTAESDSPDTRAREVGVIRVRERSAEMRSIAEVLQESPDPASAPSVDPAVAARYRRYEKELGDRSVAWAGLSEEEKERARAELKTRVVGMGVVLGQQPLTKE